MIINSINQFFSGAYAPGCVEICIFCPKTALKPRGELHGFVGGGKGLENGWIIPLEYFLQDFSFDFH